MTRRRKILWGTLSVPVVVVVYGIFRTLWLFGALDFSSGPRVTISKDTTYITEPLLENGYPDYFAAITELSSEGVTNENNAAVLMFQSLGCSGCDAGELEAIVEHLNFELWPEERQFRPFDDFYDEYTIPEEDYDTPREPIWQWTRASRRPWSAEEFPAVHQWIEANHAVGDALFEASQREHFFVPTLRLSQEDALIHRFSFPLYTQTKEGMDYLRCRAMRRIQAGETKLAIRDLQAGHQLGRLMATQPTLIGWLIGIGIDSEAMRGSRILAHEGKLTSQQIADYRQFLRELPPIPNLSRPFNGERIGILDMISMFADGRGEDNAETRNGVTRFSSCIDFDYVMARFNRRYDQYVEVARMEKSDERFDAINELEDEVLESGRGRSKAGLVAKIAFGTSRSLSDEFADYLEQLTMPLFSSVGISNARHKREVDVTDLAFALAAYRLEKGSYPEALDALVPDFIPAIPRDVYGEEPLRYRHEAEGYVVWSVGEDGVDDGDEEEPWDIYRYPVSDDLDDY